jgi:hypothetical protein
MMNSTIYGNRLPRGTQVKKRLGTAGVGLPQALKYTTSTPTIKCIYTFVFYFGF